MPSCSSSGSSSCYGSWQQSHGEPALYCEFGASFNEESTSVPNNTSTIRYSYYVRYTDDSALFYGTTRDTAGTTRVYVDGNLVSSVYVPIEYNYSDGHRGLVSGGGTCTVKHNTNGSKTINCKIDLAGGYDPRGVGFAWDSAGGSTGSMRLTDIPRGATIAVSPAVLTIDGNNKLTVTVTDALVRDRELLFKVGNYSTTIKLKNNAKTYTWTPTKDIVNQIGTSANAVAQVTVRVYAGNTKFESVARFGISVAETASSKIIKNGSRMTFIINGEFFNFDGLFGDKSPLVTKVAVALFQNGSTPTLPFLELDRVVLTKDTWNQLVADDHIKVETEEAKIYKNSSVDHQLGALGNDYETFVLKPGNNKIQCLYSDWATSPTFKLKYREVYL